MIDHIKKSNDVIRRYWFVGIIFFITLLAFAGNATSAVDVVLTPEERAWLKEHDGRIRLAISPGYAPVSFKDTDGEYRGLTMDYVRLIESRLDFRFKIIDLKSWAEIIEKAEAGEIDVVGNVQKTEKRKSFLLFSKPYVTIPNDIIARKNTDRTLSLETMHGMTLALVEGSAMYLYIAQAFPDIAIVTVSDSGEALLMVSFGRVDATVNDLAVASHLIDSFGIGNLKVAGSVPEFTWNLTFGSRKDQPLLHSILEKGLNAITPAETQRIKAKWIPWGQTILIWKNWRFYAVIAAIVIISLLAIMVWTISLRRSIARNTQALRRNMSHMRTLVETIPELVWLKDVDGVYIFCNRRFERLFGASEADIVGKTDFDFVEEELAKFFREHDQAAMAAGKPTANEETVTYSDDGHTEDLETIKTPMYDDDGQIIGVLGVARNITERNKNAHELRESEMRFKALHEASFGGIAIHEQGTILDCNQSLADITGYTEDELIDMNGLLLIDEPSREMVNNNIVSGFELPYETFGVRKNGEVYPVQLQGRNIPYKGKDARAVEFRDISDRRRAEEGLRDSEQRHRVIFENSPLGMVRFSKEGFILDCNDHFVDLMGASREELIGFDSGHKSSLGLREVLNTALAGEPATYEGYYTSVTGNKETFLHVEFNPVNAGQSPTEVIGTLEDVSARKKAQDDLHAAIEEADIAREEAMAASRSKSEFLTNMSHEIRTPLNGILGMLQLMQTTGLNSDQAEYVLAAIQSSQRLTQLLTDILDLSRVEARKLVVQSIPFDLPDTVLQVRDLYKLTSEQTGVALHCEIDPNLPQFVLGDSIRLQQVLTNLAGNAFKFTKQGSITLSAHVVGTEKSGKSRVLFSVSDTGKGIAEEQLDTLFDPFTQVSQGYTKQYQGAGLGLSICKRLVGLMGGSITIESEEGVGTTLNILIPYPIDTSTSQKPLLVQKHDDEPLSALTILLAEDERVNSLVTQRLLEKAGHTVMAVGNGQQVIEALREKTYDVILMDIQMPLMSGPEATRAIRAGKAGEAAQGIPIVAVTAYAMVGDKEKFMKSGMNGYVTKPIEFAELHDILRHLFES